MKTPSQPRAIYYIVAIQIWEYFSFYQSDQRTATGANCGATGKQPDGQTAPAMAGNL